MNRLSLSHKPAVFGYLLSAFTNRAITPDISFAEFQSLTAEFKTACEKAFGTGCEIEIKFLSSTKVTTSFYNEEAIKDLDAANERFTFSRIFDLKQATQAEWDAAKYVEATIRPVDKQKAPLSSFAHLEFKGTMPQAATYYIQGPSDDTCTTALRNVVTAHPSMKTGDGYQGNSQRSLLGMPHGFRKHAFAG